MPEVEVYYIPITEPCDFAPFYGNTTIANDIDDSAILDEYLERFADAWAALA